MTVIMYSVKWIGKGASMRVTREQAAAHRDDASHGCLLAALGTDVARQPRSVRRAFTEGLRLRLEALQKLLLGRSAAARRQKAVATMAGLVGALVLSRAVDDPKLATEIL